MSESNQHARIVNYINEIIEACRQDPTRIEVATVNFKSLLNAMKLYERAPRYFNSIFEDDENQFPQQDQMQFNQMNEKKNESTNKAPVLNELEKIYGRKLKQTDLQQLGSALATQAGIKIDRDTKRSKVALTKWFATNWQIIYPKIYELNLNTMNFNKGK